MTRERQRHFKDAPPRPEILSHEDRITPAERLERELERLSRLSRLDAMEREAGAPPRPRFPGTHADEEVSTDAVAAVGQSTEEWQVRWVLAEQDGKLVPRSLLIEAVGRTTPPGGITANMLRALSPAQAAVAAETETGDDFVALTSAHARRWVSEDRTAGRGPRKPGRPPLSDDELAAVALAYLEELREGRGVLGRLAKRFDREPATMRDRVRAARRAGFLTDAPKTGKSGGAPGPALFEYVKRSDEGARETDV